MATDDISFNVSASNDTWKALYDKELISEEPESWSADKPQLDLGDDITAFGQPLKILCTPKPGGYAEGLLDDVKAWKEHLKAQEQKVADVQAHWSKFGNQIYTPTPGYHVTPQVWANSSTHYYDVGTPAITTSSTAPIWDMPKPLPKTAVYLGTTLVDNLAGNWSCYRPLKARPAGHERVYVRNNDSGCWYFYDSTHNRTPCKTVYRQFFDTALLNGALISVHTPLDDPPAAPTFDVEPTLPVGGIDVTIAEITHAIAVLNAKDSKYIKSTLNAASNRLADANYDLIYQQELNYDYSLRTGPTKRKRAFVQCLTRILKDLGPHAAALLGPPIKPAPNFHTPLEFRYADDQPTMSGYHRKALLLDQHDRKWIFKPAPDEAHRFRPEVEHEAANLARMWGYHTADSILIDFDGHYGQAQLLHDVAHTLSGKTDVTTMTVAHQTAIALEHLLDWALDNDDSHGDNIVITTDGRLIGIDKGRAWRYFGGWQGLSGTSAANSNAQLVSTHLFTAIRNRHIPRPAVDHIYAAVIAQAQRMQYLPDDELIAAVKRAVKHRPHYHPSSYQTPVEGAPSTATELVIQAVTRKNQLVADMKHLWADLYAAAGWPVPEDHPLGANPQGHLMLSGLLDANLARTLAKSQFHGTPVFVSGVHIEDAHVLISREKVGSSYVVRGQFKARGRAATNMRAWLNTHGTPTPQPDTTETTVEMSSSPLESGAYHTIITVAKSISSHHSDGNYNKTKDQQLLLLRSTLKDIRNNSAIAQDKAMAEQYLEYIRQLLDHYKPNRVKTNADSFPRYHYTAPPPPEPQPTPEPAPDGPRVLLQPAARRAANNNLNSDGDLVMYDHNVSSGLIGNMWQIELPTGEQITAQLGADTETRLSSRGNITFTVPADVDLATGLYRIQTQLADMGCRLTPATPDDLELFYWRHLARILDNRVDTCHEPGATHPQGKGDLAAFWAIADKIDRRTSTTHQLTKWRDAFTILGANPDTVLAHGTHLPRFMHLNPRHHNHPCGKPYWERYDVTPAHAATKPFPVLSYKRGAAPAAHIGALYSTEARLRALALWHSGQSSTEDMGHGSAGFLFLRQNYEHHSESYTAYFNPRILLRTHNYAYNCDKFGNIGFRNQLAQWDFEHSTAMGASGNELMVKDALSIMDDIEIITFITDEERTQAINQYKSYGIHTIRGLPIETRFLTRDNYTARRDSLKSARTIPKNHYSNL